MVAVSFGQTLYSRGVADAADLLLKNRFFENNPALSADQAALIARPGLNYLTTVGTGPIRGLHSQPGAFGGDLFVASGTGLFRVSNDLVATNLTNGLFDPDTGVVNMAITQAIGAEPEHLFVADGRNLWVYDGVNPISTVATPDDIGIVDVVTISSQVVCLPVQEGEFIGRFYWVREGEITIDPNDFATAETYPDAAMAVKRLGDNLWLPGEVSTETWYFNGTEFIRNQGVVFPRGTWEGATVEINGVLFIVDGDGGAFIGSGGQFERVSHPGIEEMIRHAIATQQNLLSTV